MVAPRRRAELHALAARGRRRADGVGHQLDDGLARAQVGIKEVPLDLARKELAQARQVLLGVSIGRGRILVARRVRGTLGEVEGVEMGLLGDAAPVAVQEDEGGEGARVDDLENPGICTR